MENYAYIVDLQQERVLIVKDENKPTYIVVKQEVNEEEENTIANKDIANENIADEDVNNYENISVPVVKQEEELEMVLDYELINQKSQSLLPAQDGRFNDAKIVSPSNEEVMDPSNDQGLSIQKSKYSRHLDCLQPGCLGRRVICMKEKPLHCSHCGFGCSHTITLKRHMLAKHPFEKRLECNKGQYGTLSAAPGMKENIIVPNPKTVDHQCSQCNYKALKLSDLESHTLGLHSGKIGKTSDIVTNDSGNVEEKCGIAYHEDIKCCHSEFSSSNLKIDHNENKSLHGSSRVSSSVRRDQLKNDNEFIHPLVRPYQCPDCDFKTGSERIMIRHLKIHETFHQCQDCGHKSLNAEELKTHIETHHFNIKRQRCQECDYMSFNGTDFEQHFAHCHTNAKYFSSSCKFKTANIHDFKSHITSDHPDEMPFLCIQCGCNAAETEFSKKHLTKHSREEPYLCSNCNIKTSSDESMRKHTANTKNFLDHGFSKATVDSLGKHEMKAEENSGQKRGYKTASTPHDLNKHIDNKNGKQHQCSLCDYETMSSSDLKRHVDVCHEAFIYHICEYCGFETTNHVHLNRHLKAVHAKEKPYQCSQCGFRAAEADILKEHISVHHLKERYYKCPDCSYRTTSVKEMNEHTTILHSNDNIFRCEHCEYMTHSELDLKEHVTSFHTKKAEKFPSMFDDKTSIRINLDSLEEVKQNKLYQCPECEYQTSIHQHLKRHVLAVHAKEKPYKCNICEFGAVELIYLKRHMMGKHPPEMPYHCPDCDFKTRSERHMNNHAKTKHHNKKPSKLKKYQLRVPSHQEGKKQKFVSKEDQHSCSLNSKLSNNPEVQEKHFKKVQPKKKHKSDNKRSLEKVKNAPKINKNSELLSVENTVGKMDGPEVSSKGRKVKTHNCTECSFKTGRLEHLSRHMEDLHKQNMKLVCSQSVDSGSLMKRVSSKHFRKHQKVKKPARSSTKKQCLLCEHQTSSPTNLKRHQSTVHENGLDCSLCSFKTSELHCLKEHVLLKHL